MPGGKHSPAPVHIYQVFSPTIYIGYDLSEHQNDKKSIDERTPRGSILSGDTDILLMDIQADGFLTK